MASPAKASHGFYSLIIFLDKIRQNYPDTALITMALTYFEEDGEAQGFVVASSLHGDEYFEAEVNAIVGAKAAVVALVQQCTAESS